MNSQHPKQQENHVTQQGTQGNHGIIEAMNRWSGSFSKLFLPSNIGSKATIKQLTDENAKVLSMGVYMGRRTAVSGANPYDGGTYEGLTMKDESTGTLWAYETKFPDGFEHVDVEKFFISLGHVFKCHQCSGHGKIRCQKCGGKVRWKDGSKEHVCDCGDGKQDCPECSGFGQMLKVLRVDTSYYFDEKSEIEYSGALPGSLITVNSGNVIFRHISELKNR